MAVRAIRPQLQNGVFMGRGVDARQFAGSVGAVPSLEFGGENYR